MLQYAVVFDFYLRVKVVLVLTSFPSCEVQVLLSNGAYRHLNLPDLRGLFAIREMWLFFIFVVGILATGHPITLPQLDGFGLHLAFWASSLSLYIVLFAHYSKTAFNLWRYFFSGPMPLIVLSAPLVLMVTYVSAVGLVLLFEPGQDRFNAITWQMNLRNVLIAHGFETLALLSMPAAKQSEKNEKTMGAHVVLAGQRIALAEIRFVKVTKHHLEVHLTDNTLKLRERMSAFMDQVVPSDGIQTHRSYWAAVLSVEALEGASLHLHSGTVIPVARGRLGAVRIWIEQVANKKGR
jgi:hypothetical protein